MKRTTTENYRKDRFYPKIVQVTSALLQEGDVLAPVDVLIRMGKLSVGDVTDWRFGRIPYLERAVHGNLSHCNRVLRILRMHAHDLNLAPSLTVYRKWGKGPKVTLRFTKNRMRGAEEAWTRHFVRTTRKGSESNTGEATSE